ncbi:MAG: DUF3014 domain-containing protein [Motiliproteus sp.]
MSAAGNMRVSVFQQGNGVVKFLASLVLILMLAGVAYLLLMRNDASLPLGGDPVAGRSALGDLNQPDNTLRNNDGKPLTPQQLMTLKPLAGNATNSSLAGTNSSADASTNIGNRLISNDSQSSPSTGTLHSQQMDKGSAARSMSDSGALLMSSKTKAPVKKPLPSLNNSDREIRAVLVSLDATLLLTDWLVDEELVRKFVVMVDNMAAGNIPRKHSVIRPLSTSFRALEQGEQMFLDGYSFGRYGPYVDMLSALNASQVSALYRRYYPLMQQAYGELGYPRESFHERLLVAMDHLLDSPVREGNIELKRPSVMFKYADPELEQLSDVHKQMLRMGPENTRKLINRLTVLRSTLRLLGHG